MPRVTHVRADGLLNTARPGFSSADVREIQRPLRFAGYGIRSYVSVPGFVGRALLRTGARNG